MARVRLAFLGPPHIELDGAPVHLDTRKAVALLAYLGVVGEAVSRDALVTLLWSRYGRVEGHAALRRTLSTLRAAFGPGFLDAERETVGLAKSSDVWIDLLRSRELLVESAGHDHGEQAICRQCLPLLSEAAKLYRGEFLLGFTLKDSVDFDNWQFLTTEKYRIEAAHVLDRLVLGTVAAGDFRLALGYAHQRLSLDRLDESAHALLMRLFAWEGNRTAARHQFDECKRLLTEELDSAPQEATVLLAEMIAQGRAPELPVFVDGAHDKDRTTRAGAAKTSDHPAWVVAVLPFENMSADPEQSYLGDGMTEDLITGLATINAIRVPARHMMLGYKGRAVNVNEIKRDVAATHVVAGSVRRSESRIRINVQLIEAASGNHLWARRYDSELTGIFEAQDEIVHDIVTELDARLAHGEQARAWRRSTKNAEAYDFFRQAQYLAQHAPTRPNLERALALLQRAQALDPGFLSTYVWEAHVFTLQALFGYQSDAQGTLQLALARAEKAVLLDDTSGEAHAVKAQLLFILRQYPDAEAETQRAIDLDPRLPDTYQVLGLLRLHDGRYEEALSHFHRQNDFYGGTYFNPWGIRFETISLVALGKLEEAMSFISATLGKGPELAFLLAHRAAIACALGRGEESRTAREELLARIPAYRSIEPGLLQSGGVHTSLSEWYRKYLSAAGIP